MMRRMMLTMMLAAAMTLAAIPAMAMDMDDGMEMASPGGGPAFGEHVSSRAPEHPIRMGSMFGNCVSNMATGQCPHA